MKKNMFLRVASVLLVLTLLSTCAISGTFAKYVTAGSNADSARVAKWGVTVNTVAADANTAFAKTYATDSGSAIANTVEAEAKVVAPGTQGTLASVVLSGKPEVAVNIKYEATVELTGWTIADGEYCPIVFTVNTKEIKIDNATISTVSDLAKAVADEINGLSADYAAGTDLATATAVTPAISWKWDFNGDDVKDTALGDLTTAPTVAISFTTTVTQID